MFPKAPFFLYFLTKMVKTSCSRFFLATLLLFTAVISACTSEGENVYTENPGSGSKTGIVTANLGGDQWESESGTDKTYFGRQTAGGFSLSTNGYAITATRGAEVIKVAVPALTVGNYSTVFDVRTITSINDLVKLQQLAQVSYTVGGQTYNSVNTYPGVVSISSVSADGTKISGTFSATVEVFDPSTIQIPGLPFIPGAGGFGKTAAIGPPFAIVGGTFTDIPLK